MNKNQHLFTTTFSEEGQRLDLFLKNQLPEFSRSQIQKWIKKGAVSCDGQKTRGAMLLKNDMNIKIDIPEEEVDLIAEEIPLEILYEDADMLAVQKPAGMVTHPAAGHPRGTLANAIWHYLQKQNLKHKLDARDRRPGIVHRLDRDTSGILLVAKSTRIQEALASQFREREIRKTYRVLVAGKLSVKEGEIEGAIGKENDSARMAVLSTGKYSKTDFRVLKVFRNATYVEVYPKTGRTHQIRVHLEKIGHPVLGDVLYGETSGLCKRHMLHAYQIEFTHPRTRKKLTLKAPLPKDFQGVLKKLK